MRKILNPRPIILKGYCHNVKEAVSVTEGLTLATFQKTARRLDYPSLLPPIHILLGRRLYVFTAGLNLYKMYSSRIDRNQIYLEMSRSPISLDNRLSYAFQVVASKILSGLA